MKEKLSIILNKLRQALSELYGDRLSKLILFGSQARGDAETGSDIDVMVLLQGPVIYREESKRAGELLAQLSLEYDEVISCLFIDQNRFETEQSPLMMNVRREGLML